MSKQKRLAEYYKKSREERLEAVKFQRLLDKLSVLKKSSASVSTDKFQFTGEAVVMAAVVRSDLNGYSQWASKNSLSARADLLDDFFSHAISNLENNNGVYFRDEGDCIVSIFSQHFEPGLANSNIKAFCKSMVGRTYGGSELTAKCSVSVGEIAIFQKNHEVGTDDWCAEGQAFVKTARLEQSVESKACIYYFKEDFEQYFEVASDYAAQGGVVCWENDIINLQVPGIGGAGGWSEITVQRYLG